MDSLILHSGYADIRLESYLFTEQAFAYFKWVLKMGGVFATYNYFRQEWAIERKDWERIAPTTIINEIGTPRFATDDWPFLYLRDRLIPNLSIRPMIVLGLLGVAMVYLFLPKVGAAFDLMAACFSWAPPPCCWRPRKSSNWRCCSAVHGIINSLVFFAVLILVPLANLFVLKVPSARLSWHYTAC